jgi:hypothetical protein
LELRVVKHNKYTVLAVTDRGTCEVLDQLTAGEATTEKHRLKLLQSLLRISEVGLHTAERTCWIKPLDADAGIYELKASKLRLFCFKGHGDQLVICTSLGRKTSQRADRLAIAHAKGLKQQYEDAIDNGTLRLSTGE